MLLDRVVETTDVVGTGTMNLLGAATIDGVVMRRFVTIAGSGKTVAYLIVDTAGNWEFGIGVVTSGSPDTLTRATILRSSNSDAAVSFLSGTKYVYATANSDLLRFGSHGLPTLGGTADARTLANAPPLKALTPGMTFVVLNGAAANATTTPNVTIDSIAGAKTVVLATGGALALGDMAASGLLVLTWDGTNLRLRNPATQTLSIAISSQSGDYTALPADRGKLIDFTAAATLSLTAAATLGAGWFCYARNSASAVVTIDPNSSETIDGGATMLLPPGAGILIECDGSNFKTIGRAPGATPPQGRLTLTSATPVLAGDVAGATTIYYTPYVGQLVPIYSGSAWSMVTFAELSNATAQSSTGKAGPAAVANNSNYDLFVWNDAGTLRLTRGPAWSSDTARGTGAGTTELQMVGGILTNKVAITNGPGANLGTYVGTVRSNGSAAIDWKLGSLAAGGGEARLCVWNAYNRVDAAALVRDSNDSWTLASGSIRSADNSATMRATLVRGLDEDRVAAEFTCPMLAGSTGWAGVGVGLDSTSAFSGFTGTVFSNSSNQFTSRGGWAGMPGLGLHYIQALETAQTAGTATFYGDSGAATFIQNGLKVELRA